MKPGTILHIAREWKRSFLLLGYLLIIVLASNALPVNASSEKSGSSEQRQALGEYLVRVGNCLVPYGQRRAAICRGTSIVYVIWNVCYT